MRLTGHGQTPGIGPLVDRYGSRPAALLFILSSLALIFVLDRNTDLAPIQHLYYFPIAVAGIRFGHRGGILVAIAAIVLYHLANVRVFSLQYEEVDLVQMVVFLALGVTSAKLTSDSRRLHRLANTDDLTGLHNLRSFEGHLQTLVRVARQDASPLAMLVLDLDRLKALNDLHGHLAGAEAVRTVGRILADRLPAHAFACRYGGDEFAVVLPGGDDAQASAVAEDLRRAVNACAPVLAGTSFPAATLSLSIGVASRRFEPHGPSSGGPTAGDDAAGEDLFHAADAALYAAKRGGRNRVSTADGLGVSAGLRRIAIP